MNPDLNQALSTACHPGAKDVGKGGAAAAGSEPGAPRQLRSDDYLGLDPGFWVAFVGQFDTAEEAQRTADRYSGLFPTAYQRWIEEK